VEISHQREREKAKTKTSSSESTSISETLCQQDEPRINLRMSNHLSGRLLNHLRSVSSLKSNKTGEADMKGDTSMDQASYLKAREREEIMKRLVSSQETYIKELEGKVGGLESTLDQKNVESTNMAASDWESEKNLLLDLVKKNQDMSEEIE
jgi:hypothetical protein